MPQFFILLVAFTFLSCEEEKHIPEDVAYFGGEVINPKNDYVVLLKSKKVIDTIKLDNSNRFVYKFDSLVPGLYSFKLKAADGMEHQMVLLEARDSIMFRLNTLEFDESLVYTGNGAKKNNYLIDLFLESEQEDKVLLEYSQLPPREFEKKVDSLRELKLEKLEKFDADNEHSSVFDELVEVNINYDYYLSKEVYPFMNYSQNEKETMESLPNDFYDYRKDIDYNYALVEDYFPYYNFLRHHFENMALTEHFENSQDSVYNRKCLGYNLTRLRLIDSLVKEDEIKNPLLVRAAIDFMSDNKQVEQYDELVESFMKKSTDQRHKDYVSNVVSSLKDLKPGNSLPEVLVYNTKGEEVILSKVLRDKKPKVIYFWTPNSMDRFKDSHNKANELKVKYPEVEFFAINTSDQDMSSWVDTLKNYRSLDNQEYLFKNSEEARKKLAIYPLNKVMILDKNSKIVNPHTNMFSINFEEQLLGLLNQ